MNLLKKLSKKKEENIIKEDKILSKIENTTNYLLTDLKEENIQKNSFSISLDSLYDLNNNFELVANAIKSLPKNEKGEIFGFKNFNIKDCNELLNKLPDIDLKKVPIDPTAILIAAVLIKIESDINEIKTYSKNILNFLEDEKESEIEGDLIILNELVSDYKFNWNDKNFLITKQKETSDIRRTAAKNITFYKKQLMAKLSEEKLITTNKFLNNLKNDLITKLKYYRLCIYICSYATFLDILLLGNYQEEYLKTKVKKIKELQEQYLKDYNLVLEKLNYKANKSLEGNLISEIGKASKSLGDLSDKVPLINNKSINNWMSEKGELLKEKGTNMKKNISNDLDNLEDTNVDGFVENIENINMIYNHTKSIFFNKKKIYLEYLK